MKLLTFSHFVRLSLSKHERRGPRQWRCVDRLLEEHVAGVYRFALRLTGDRQKAEDLTQETLLRAWQHRAGLREPRTVRVWMLRIAANLWRDQLRRQASPVAQASALVDGVATHLPPPQRIVSGQEDLRRALDALDALPSRQRDVLYLSACEQLSLREIADVLGITTDNAKAHLSLARKKMRQQLHDLFADL